MKKSNYSKENLIKALEEYKNGTTSSEVSLKYGVPASTVRNHNSNSQMTFGSGHPTVLKIDQEQYLVELLKNLEIIGLRLMKTIVMKLASEYVKLITGTSQQLQTNNFFEIIYMHLLGKSIDLGRKWLTNFLNRWKSELKMIKEKNRSVTSKRIY